MDKYLYQKLYEQEKKNWWPRAKQDLVLNILSGWFSEKKPKKILDLGCGAGGLMESLARFKAQVWGIDVEKLAINFAKKRGIKNVKVAKAEKLPFKSSQFDWLVSMDVLEHVKEDGKAIAEIFRVLRPGGRALISVPANPKLLTDRDRRLHHFRRYLKTDLVEKFESAGFVVRRVTYITVFFYPVLWLFARLKRIDTKPTQCGVDFLVVPNWLNNLLFRILKYEESLLTRRNFRFGTSLMMSAVKPQITQIKSSR